MTSETQKLLLLELLDKVRRSWWTVIAGGCLGVSLAVVGLHFTTPVYEAEATIEADVEKLPPEFVRRTISDDVEVQLGELRNAVLSDKNLNTVITSVFGAPQSDLHESSLADRIASNVSLNFSRRTQTINVRFRDRVPERAARVANMLADFFVIENKGLRTESARQVRESMESLAVEGSVELEEAKAALNKLLIEHPQELESQRVNHEHAIVQLRGELADNEEAIRSARRRLSVLESQSRRRQDGENGNAGVPDGGMKDVGSDPRVAELEREIDELLTKLTENHPDVVRKRQELERLSAAIANEGQRDSQSPAPPEDSSAQPPSFDVWSTRLQAARLVVQRLEDGDQEIRRQIAKYRAYLRNMPVIQQRVDDLSGRVTVLEQTNLDKQRKIETARAGQQLEEEDFANPFVVTRHAMSPAEPVWPNRIMFLGAGVVAGLLLFTGPMFALAFLRPTILSEDGLRSLADVPVLVVVPTVQTPAVARKRRAAGLRNFGLSALSVAILIGVAAMEYVGLI